MRAAVVLTLACAALTGPSHGQEAVVREARCWIGSSTFSAGAAMNVGDAVAICDATTGWTALQPGAAASGCLLEGELSSVGAIVGIRNNASMVLQCDPGGRWVTIEPQLPETDG